MTSPPGVFASDPQHLQRQRFQYAMSLTTTPFALVVDDDALILMHACDILEEAGFRFYEAGDGDAALRLLERFAENVILLFTDVEMPGSISGFDLARKVDERWPDIEIVVASGRISPSLGDMPERATFISKPFSKDIVHDHLRRTLPDGKKPRQLLRAVWLSVAAHRSDHRRRSRL